MAEGVSTPLSFPADTSGVATAKTAVKGLQDTLRGLGPAAEEGAGKASKAVNGIGKTAKSKSNEFVPQKVSRKGGGIDKVTLSPIPESITRSSGVGRVKSRFAEAGGAKAFQDKAPKPLGAGMIAGLAVVVAALGKVASVAGDVIAKMLEIAASFAKALVSANAFKEATLSAYTKILGGAEKANEAYRETVKLSSKIGVSVQDALSGVNSLIAKGFKADAARDLLKAMADLKAVVPEANIKNLLLAITQIKSKGVLQMEELQGQIAEAGLSVSVVLEEIGKKIGKSAKEVRAMISQGKISADQGVQGILAAIQKTTGKPLGKAAEEAANQLGGLLSRVQDLPTALFMAADSSKGLATLKDVLQNILGVFAPGTATGDALAASIGRLGDAFSTLIGGLAGAKGKDAFTKFATALTGTIDKVAAWLNKFGPEIGDRIANAVRNVGDLIKVFETFAAPIVRDIELVLALLRAIDSLSRKIQGIPEPKSLDDILSGPLNPAGAQAKAQASGQSIGAMIVAGIIAGITGGVPSLVATVAGMTASTTAAAQTGLQIKSPSRLFEKEVGAQIPAGAAVGVARGTPALVSAVDGMTAATVSAGAPAGSLGAGKGMRAGVTIAAGAVVVNVSVDGRHNPHAIAQAIGAELRVVLHEVANA